MSTLTVQKLSGSTDFKPIKVAATATAGTLIHTAHGTAYDQIWLYVDNDTTSDILLTIEFGGTTDVDHTIKTTIKGRGNVGEDGSVLVIPGLYLTNSLVVRAFAGTANVLKINGYVHRVA